MDELKKKHEEEFKKQEEKKEAKMNQNDVLKLL